MTQPSSKRLVTEAALAATGIFNPVNPPSPDPANRVRDPSFNNLGTWVFPSGGNRTNDNIVRTDDDNDWYLRILTNQSTSLPNATQTAGEEKFRVWPGDDYRFTALWRKAGSNQTNGKLMFRLSYFDIDGNANAEGGYYDETQIPMNGITGSAWTQFSMDVTIPTNTAYAQVFVGTYMTDAGGYWDFDKICVYQRITTDRLPLWQVDTEMVNMQQYGALPSATATVNSAAITQATTDHGAARYIFPANGNYNLNQPIPAGNWRSFEGVGGTSLTCLQSLLSPFVGTGGGSAEQMKFSNMRVTNSGSSNKAILNFDGLTGSNYCINIDFDRVHFDQQENAAILSMVNTAGSSSLYGLRIRNSKLTSVATSSTAAINVSTNTVGVNDWLIDGCFMHFFGNMNVPFIYMAYQGGNTTGFTALRMSNCIVEQPRTGFVNMQGCVNPQFVNCAMWDMASLGAWNASCFRFAASSSSIPCFGVHIDNCGMPSSTDNNFPSPHQFIRITGSGTATNHNIGFNYTEQTKLSAVYT